MQVRPGCKASLAHVADKLPSPDALTWGCDCVRHVCIERLGAIAVRDDDVVAVTAVPRAVVLGDDDRASSSSVDGRPLMGGDVDGIPAVDALPDKAAGHGVSPVAVLGRACATDVG